MHLFRNIFLGLFCASSLCLNAQTQIVSVPTEDNLSFDLENWLAKAYVTDATTQYTDEIGRMGTSILNSKVLGKEKAYYLSKLEEHQDCSPNFAEQPIPVAISTPQKGSVMVSRHPSFTKDTISFAATVGTTNLYNLIPQTVYWYRIKNTSGTVVSTGIFKTQGTLRMIYSPKVLNIRDIGGWACSGGKIAYGKILRGATLDGTISKEGTKPVGAVDYRDIDMLKRICGVTHDFDTRGETSTTSPLKVTRKNYNMSAYVYLLTNTYASTSGGVTRVKTGNYYTTLKTCFKDIISVLESGGCSYLHCTYGADRTGTFFAILEAMLGVSVEDIVKDWELTSFMTIRYTKRIDDPEMVYYYVKSDGSVGYSYAELRAFFQYLYDNYGGKGGASVQDQVIKWLKSKVLTTSTEQAYIDKLKSLLVVPDSKSPTIVKACGNKNVGHRYSVTTSSTLLYTSVENKLASINNGAIESNENCCMTDYISCSSYKYLLLNEKLKNAAVFYDSSKKYISGVGDSTQDASSVVYASDNVQYSIPSKACYVRFNMPKYSPWTAVLSYESLK